MGYTLKTGQLYLPRLTKNKTIPSVISAGIRTKKPTIICNFSLFTGSLVFQRLTKTKKEINIISFDVSLKTNNQ